MTSAASQDPVAIRAMFTSIARRYDLANHLLSGGLDYLWRRRVARIVRSWRPRLVLDLATGSGDLALALRRHCPDCEILAADFCLPMLQEARKKKLPALLCADGMNLPLPDAALDGLTISFGLRNMASYAGAAREFARVLRPGGRLLILDFSLPSGLLRPPYRWYLHSVLPQVAGFLTGRPEAYRYLGESIEAFPREETMTRLLRDNGFAHATAHPWSLGIVSAYIATK